MRVDRSDIALVVRSALSARARLLLLPVLETGLVALACVPGLPWQALPVAGAVLALGWLAGFGVVTEAIVKPRWRRRARRLGDLVAFQLAVPGHAALIAMALIHAGAAMLAWRAAHPVVGIVLGVVVVATLALLARLSPLAPWYGGPALIAAPHGVQIRGYRVPWTAIEKVGQSATGLRGAWIRTRVTLSAYARNRVARQEAVAGRTLHVAPLGALPESMRAYLQARRDIETRRASARAANARAAGS